MPAFDLTFGEAHHGWLDVSLHVGEYTADLSASGVLNDPLEESVDVAVALSAEEHVYMRVRFWEEPGWTELRFVSERASTSVEIDVVEVDDHDHEKTLSRLRADRSMVATRLVAMLGAMDAVLPATGSIEGWVEFPSTKLRRIREPAAERVFVLPWKDARGLQRAVDEALVEIGPSHPLHGVDLQIVGRHVDTDDYLFSLRTGPHAFVVVHLTWSGGREKSPLWPSVEMFSSWTDWVEQRMKPDAASYRPDE